MITSPGPEGGAQKAEKDNYTRSKLNETHKIYEMKTNLISSGVAKTL